MILAYADYKKPFRLNTDASEKGLGVILYQTQDDGRQRVITYASRSLSKTEKNYDAHKLEFLAVKWSVTEHFHEYLYGDEFDVYMDNNPLTYVLTTAKLDATGQRWIANLANYNFKIFYHSGKLKIDGDSLSRIPWEMELVRGTTLDSVLLKSTIVNPQISIPMLPNAVIPVCKLVIGSESHLTRTQWKQEQRSDYSLKRLIELLECDELLSYSCDKQHPSDLKCMLRLRKDFFLENGLLYSKAYFKVTDKHVNQVVMPQQFRKRTVQACHEDYGH